MGRRLQQIEAMIARQYTHIWDCCCDHGQLGFSLLNAQAAQTVHFVDIVPKLLEQIEQTLRKYWQGDNKSWQVHCTDAGKLPIKQFSGEPQTDKHLLIIAGIGGDLVIELLQSLLSVTAGYHVEYILCPVHHNYKVRQFLIKNHFMLINEALVFENKRGYEILHVSLEARQPLSPVGSVMWDFSDPLHLDYLHKTIRHYQRIAKNPDMDVTAIINQYQRLGSLPMKQ
ncbi:MAG: tRNA (adenine(22)-N(1))-methyltransferase TrmK [Psychromonas sp.]|nr:tRNA (adenine(22)-N(1))-methyltransferase TrmK [Psychromonas sp.]